MANTKLFRGGEFLITDALPEEVFTPEDFTEEHRLIGQAAKDFAIRELVPKMEELEKLNPELLTSLIRKSAELGFSSLLIPEAYGGAGAGFVSSTVAFDNINQGVTPFIIAFSMQAGMGCLGTVLFGTEEQRKRYASKLASAELIGAYALTEPNHGSDALGAETTAVLSKDGKYYILNGQKSFSTSAGFTDLWSTYAQVDGDKFTSFIVEKKWDGVILDEEEEKMGLHGSSTRSILFQDVKVPVENVLGGIGRGHVVALNALNIGRWKVGATALGSIKAMIADIIKYAKGRVQFGKPICEFGLIKHKIAEMIISCYVLESMVYRIASIFDLILGEIDLESDKGGIELGNRLKEYAVEGSISKIFGSEAQWLVADECVQVMGGYGYIKGCMAERSYRDFRIQRIWEGTNEINRMLIINTLLQSAREDRLPLLSAIDETIRVLKTNQPEDHNGQGILDTEKSIVSTSKKIALCALGLAFDRFKNKLREEQEVEALVADMSMQIFGMESTLLRALKNIEKSRDTEAQLHALIASSYIRDTFPKVVLLARQVMAASTDGEELETWLSIIKKHDRFKDVNLIPIRQKIADTVVPIARYPFAQV